MLQRRTPDKVRVGEVLVQKGLITPEDLAQALSLQRGTQLKLGEVLVQQKLVTWSQLNQALAEQRRRNWTAAILLSLSTGFAFAPKLVASNTGAAVTPAAQTLKSEQAATGGGEGQPWTPKRTPSIQALKPSVDKGFYTPLTANRYPSVSSPLTGFCHPLNGQGYLSQGIRGTTHRGRMEYAYDLAAGIGTPVYAMRAGRVIGVQDRYPDTGGGPEKISQFNYIMIEHDGGYRSAYLHLQQGFRSQVQIKAGDRVEMGQLIGYSGNSGWSSGPHLHIELQKPGNAYSFTQTVPFAIAGICEPGSIASNTP